MEDHDSVNIHILTTPDVNYSGALCSYWTNDTKYFEFYHGKKRNENESQSNFIIRNVVSVLQEWKNHYTKKTVTVSTNWDRKLTVNSEVLTSIVDKIMKKYHCEIEFKEIVGRDTICDAVKCLSRWDEDEVWAKKFYDYAEVILPSEGYFVFVDITENFELEL